MKRKSTKCMGVGVYVYYTRKWAQASTLPRNCIPSHCFLFILRHGLAKLFILAFNSLCCRRCSWPWNLFTFAYWVVVIIGPLHKLGQKSYYVVMKYMNTATNWYSIQKKKSLKVFLWEGALEGLRFVSSWGRIEWDWFEIRGKAVTLHVNKLPIRKVNVEAWGCVQCVLHSSTAQFS